MELCVLVSAQMSPDEALEFLDKIEPKLKSSREAQALCRLSKGEIKLLKQNDVQAAKVREILAWEYSGSLVELTARQFLPGATDYMITDPLVCQ